MQVLPNEILNHITSFSDIDTRINMYKLGCKCQKVIISDEFPSLFENRAKSSLSRFVAGRVLVHRKNSDFPYILDWGLWRETDEEAIFEWYRDLDVYYS
jgi:hypothetical protein